MTHSQLTRALTLHLWQDFSKMIDDFGTTYKHGYVRLNHPRNCNLRLITRHIDGYYRNSPNYLLAEADSVEAMSWELQSILRDGDYPANPIEIDYPTVFAGDTCNEHAVLNYEGFTNFLTSRTGLRWRSRES